MSEEIKMAEVTQADVDRAQEVMGFLDAVWSDGNFNGVVKYFARHRIAALRAQAPAPMLGGAEPVDPVAWMRSRLYAATPAQAPLPETPACICGGNYPMTDDSHAINCPAAVNYAAFKQMQVPLPEDVAALVEEFEAIVQKHGFMYRDLDVADNIIALIHSLQREVERLREFERRVTDEGMRDAARYWEGRYRDEADQLTAAQRVKDEAVGLLQWASDNLHEINEFNYNHDDVLELNAKSVEVALGIMPFLAKHGGK
jgi:hypothetical protein